MNCYKLTINHIGLFGEGFLKKVEFQLRRRDEISIGSHLPTVKPGGCPSFLLSHLGAAVPSVLLRRKGHLSHNAGTQRAPNILPHGHICFSICITFPQGSPETMVCLHFLPFIFISLASEPSLARSTLVKGTGKQRIIRLIHYWIIQARRFRALDLNILTVNLIVHFESSRSLFEIPKCEMSSVSFDPHTDNFRSFTLCFSSALRCN